MSARQETKTLDNKLQILYTLKEYFLKTRNLKIRRAVFKAAADERLFKMDPERDEFGHGMFNNVIKYLEDEDAITSIRDKLHNSTEFWLNVPKIEGLIQRREYEIMIGKIYPNPVEEEDYFPLLPDVVMEVISKRLDNSITHKGLKLHNNLPGPLKKLSAAHYITKLAVKDLSRIMTPTIYKFHLKSPQVDRYPTGNRILMSHLLDTASRMASYSPETPFRLVLEYSGLPDHSPIWMNQIIKNIIPSMEIFCREIFQYNFTKDDIQHLESGAIDLLSPTGKQHFDIFWKDYFFPMLLDVI